MASQGGEDEGVRAWGGERKPDPTLKREANLRSRYGPQGFFHFEGGEDIAVQNKLLSGYKPCEKKRMARVAGATEEEINAPRPANCERTGRKDTWLHEHLNGLILRGRARDEQRQTTIALNRAFAGSRCGAPGSGHSWLGAGPLIKCGGRNLRCTCQQRGTCEFCCMPDASCTWPWRGVTHSSRSSRPCGSRTMWRRSFHRCSRSW
jgi:hypothetical protein